MESPSGSCSMHFLTQQVLAVYVSSFYRCAGATQIYPVQTQIQFRFPLQEFSGIGTFNVVSFPESLAFAKSFTVFYANMQWTDTTNSSIALTFTVVDGFIGWTFTYVMKT